MANHDDHLQINSGAVLVTTTLPGQEMARSLARQIVESRLAACVQVLQVESVYRWKGNLEETPEWLCLIKTTAETEPRLKEFLLGLHPYELPEYTVMPFSGSQAYLDWVTMGIENK